MPAHLAGLLNYGVGCALEELFGDEFSLKCVKGVCYRCVPGEDLCAFGFLFSPRYLSLITAIRLALPQQGRSHSTGPSWDYGLEKLGQGQTKRRQILCGKDL